MQLRKSDPYAIKSTFFDDKAQKDWAAGAYGPDERRKLDRLFALTGPLAGLRLLEPGCGTGRLTELLARQVGILGHVVAVDISPCMVDQTRLKLSGCENVEIHLGPMEEEIGFEHYFDLVICHQVFPHFEDQTNALIKISSMLKPGGRLVISHFISSAEINDVHSKAGSAVAHDLMPPPETMQRMFEQCGFLIEDCLDDSEGYLLKARLI
jgi:demethylmenaquinone methyltransferase/2-methoxy-6-polyprenyl-1,4-benzoquinol methylase